MSTMGNTKNVNSAEAIDNLAVRYVFPVGAVSPSDTSNFTCTWSGTGPGPKPSDYLSFAVSDFEDASRGNGDSVRHCINAISNAKRALHLQVESLCESFGFNLMRNRPRTFPARVEYLERSGVIGKRLLRKLNSVRNDVEHEYRFATLEEAELAVDVTELFIESCRLYRARFPISVQIDIPTPDSTGEVYLREVEACWSKGIISLNYKHTADSSSFGCKKQEVDVNQPEYFEWVRFLVACID
ncbi:DUF4145 domain-containing protein [Burkholderia cenocepacia]|uniref:hypothetical protein n=1 Tax=Burkholderia cenocepacia TaxID=95486 RepID=UPI002AB76FB8|nr:hypothetical protein [Burkholderia cenocepacia]